MRFFVFIVVAALGCAPSAPAVVPSPSPTATPPPPREADVVRSQVEALSAQLAAAHGVLARETWAALLDGGTPGTSPSPATREALALIRRAQALEAVDARRLRQ
ncbi:MAG: hypothetical protein JNG84_10635, partial [Archangium sp.]|nr:hypothetical protein [Archangium sp.]